MIGLLTVRRGLGTYVAESNDLENCINLIRTAMTLSSRELLRFMELREAIEIYCARQAAQIITDAQADALEALCAKMESETMDHYEAMRLDFQFHLKIVEIMGNELMVRILQMIQEFVLEGMRRTTPRPRQRLFSRTAHMVIVQALRAHDSDAAQAAVTAHMDVLRRRLEEADSEKGK